METRLTLPGCRLSFGTKKVDNTILDLVADVSAPTPSLAAQYIVDHNMKYIKISKTHLFMKKNEILFKNSVF